MPHYTYLIIGGGMTASAAIGGIREVDANGSVGLIGADLHPPYDRPPLSKGLWKGKSVETIWRKEPQGVTLHLGREAQTLDPRDKRVTDDQGTVYTFDKLLIATGGAPRRLPFGGDDIIYYRNLDDYERLRALTAQSPRFAVIGGGWVDHHPTLRALFDMDSKPLAWFVIGYGFIAAVLPVWLLLAPRDYLSTFLKLGTVLLLAIAVVLMRPEIKMPAITQFVDGTGPIFGGALFPFVFITIACGAISGFHALVSSGTTPKLIGTSPSSAA